MPPTSNIRRLVRQTQRSPGEVFARVEALIFGMATVRIGGGGARLTNLPVMGGTINVGDTVLVDYSSETPTVRPIGVATELALEGTGPSGAEPRPLTKGDVSFSVFGSYPQAVYSGDTVTVSFADSRFDTEAFLDTENPTYVTIPYDGFYYFSAHVGLDVDTSSGITNELPSYFWITLTSSIQGTFATGEGIAVDSTTDIVPAIGFVTAHLACISGEKISLSVQNNTGEDGTLSVHAQGAYPRLMGYRIDRNREIAAPASAVSPEYDDSDVEIRGNSGYLHYADKDGAYARALANMDDTSDVDLTMDFQFETIDGSGVFRVWLRSSLDWYDRQTPTTGYELAINCTGSWSIHRVESGVRTQLDSVTTSPTTNVQQLHFQVSGNYIRASVWLESESEPVSWDSETNDTGGFTTAGGLQLGYFRNTGENHMVIDNLYAVAP